MLGGTLTPIVAVMAVFSWYLVGAKFLLAIDTSRT